jgi:hypothetical protein
LDVCWVLEVRWVVDFGGSLIVDFGDSLVVGFGGSLIVGFGISLGFCLVFRRALDLLFR